MLKIALVGCICSHADRMKAGRVSSECVAIFGNTCHWLLALVAHLLRSPQEPN
jgi:hypothetical protein